MKFSAASAFLIAALCIAPLRADSFDDLAAKAAGGDLPLWGTLVWKDKPAGWKTQWSFGWRGHVYRWVAAGISFDEAFRRGFEGAAQIMSGHGAPG